jgi:hypothetical protein
MFTVSIKYTCKYHLNFANEYKWTTCGKCINVQSGRVIKQILKGGSIGYVVRGKFYTLKYLRTQLTKIERIDMPF